MRPRKPPSTTPELHLRRLTVDEALYRLGRFLDEATFRGQVSVRVIHGKGTGTLKRAVWDFLATQPNVLSYRLADPGDGDSGVTMVELWSI